VYDRPYVSAADADRALDALLVQRAGGRPDCYPTMYRLRMLLISRLWSPERNAHVWSDSEGRLWGCALLLQGRPDSPRFELACITHPRAPDTLLADRMLPWARARGQEIAEERAAPIMLEHEVGDHEAATIALLVCHGFTPLTAQALYMARPLDTPLPEPVPAASFTIRALAGRDEVDAYLALYNQVSMPLSRTHRLALMDTPDHSPALDLVAVEPDGVLTAFCECSISKREWRTGERQAGWIDHVGTRPAMQGRGLGRAITLAGLQRLQASGADMALLATHSANARAQRLYEHLGFKTVGKGLWLAKEFGVTRTRGA